ncbi:MAG: LptF/LptG family permease [Kiritimatiellae bacterium]|nr:LptF/LptG family permease [Kiritimatiellia bacterium]
MIRVFNRHFLGDFLKSFLLCAAVLTFVMYIGSVIKAIDYLSKGASASLVLKVFTLNIPYTLSFVIPISALVASLLQFGRLSADGEITAMRASGLSLPQMAAPFLVAAALLSAFCLWLNAEVAPRSHFERRSMLRDLTKENPLTLIEEATFVDDFPGVSVYVGRKDGNHLQDIILYQYENGQRRADVEASSGDLSFDPDAGRLSITLENVRLTEYDKANPRDLTKTRTLVAESYPLSLDVGNLLKKSKINKKPSDMPMRELVSSLRDVRQAFPSLQEDSIGKMRAKMAVEATQRLALALACFSFVLVAVPLGVRPTRRETSGGIWMALLRFMFFYLFIIVSDALVDKPELRPELIPLFPVLVLQAYGFWKLWRLR